MRTHMPYLVAHDVGCACQSQTLFQADTLSDIVCYCWGRDMALHTIFLGECPYRFVVGDMDLILATLTLYPPAVVRHLLPLDIYLGSLQQHGVGRHSPDAGRLVCVIGTSCDRERSTVCP